MAFAAQIITSYLTLAEASYAPREFRAKDLGDDKTIPMAVPINSVAAGFKKASASL